MSTRRQLLPFTLHEIILIKQTSIFLSNLLQANTQNRYIITIIRIHHIINKYRFLL